MKKITEKQFLKDVAHEIEQLKLHATQEEIGNLNFLRFDPDYPRDCIYGQMTGFCGNQRAKELMDMACVKVFHNIHGTRDLYAKDFDTIKDKINGAYEGQTWVEAKREYTFLSALEGYICLKDAKVEHIFDYLKGRVDTLSL